jgi:predicted RNA binding protein YcfA (HicA-like mRNA interferase family)
MNYSAKYLIKILEKNGYIYRRSNGSHQLFYHPEKNKTVIVPVHGNKGLFPKARFIRFLNKQDLIRLICFKTGHSL